MKKIIPCLFLMVMFWSAAVSAHPASEIQIKYASDTQLLTIKIKHESKDFEKHYIEKVWVTINKNENVVQGFSSQDDSEGLTLTYKIFNVKKGDVIAVDTKCNIFGKKAAKIEIE